MRRSTAGATAVATIAATIGLFSGAALASGGSSVGPIKFEPSEGYTVGNINGQNGWSKTGPYDVAVDSVSSFPNAAGFGFGQQALRASDAVTSGSFGDQTFSPGVDPAGESTGLNHFDASFSIGSTQSTVQPGLTTAVSPDSGDGSRMSYLRFEDRNDGIHVLFRDVNQPGPCSPSGCAKFETKDIATLSRTQPHAVSFWINFVPGPHNDVVKVFIDGVPRVTGTTWEDYYRYDPEQAGNHNVVPTTSKLLFREAGNAAPATSGKGFLFDNVFLNSANNDSMNNCGTVEGGTYATATVPSGVTCRLTNVTVTNDVNVQSGGTLLMKQSSIGHNLKADHPAGIGIYLNSSIGNDAVIDGVTGGSGDGYNYICYTHVGHDLNVVNSAASASPWAIGSSADCGVSDTVDHNLNVNKNKNAVDVSRNHVGNVMSVTGNTGGTTVQDNQVGSDANCGSNSPPTSYSGNTAGGKNTCQ